MSENTHRQLKAMWTVYLVGLRSPCNFGKQETMVLFQQFLCSIISKTRKKNYQRFQTVDLLNTFWDPLTYNVAKGQYLGVLGVEMSSTILDSGTILGQVLLIMLQKFFIIFKCFSMIYKMQDSFFYNLAECNFW